MFKIMRGRFLRIINLVSWPDNSISLEYYTVNRKLFHFILVIVKRKIHPAMTTFVSQVTHNYIISVLALRRIIEIIAMYLPVNFYLLAFGEHDRTFNVLE